MKILQTAIQFRMSMGHSHLYLQHYLIIDRILYVEILRHKKCKLRHKILYNIDISHTKSLRFFPLAPIKSFKDCLSLFLKSCTKDQNCNLWANFFSFCILSFKMNIFFPWSCFLLGPGPFLSWLFAWPSVPGVSQLVFFPSPPRKEKQMDRGKKFFTFSFVRHLWIFRCLKR